MEIKLQYPVKILYDIGGNFITGMSLGSFYYLYKGIYKSQKKHKLKKTLKLITHKAPRIGGNFASWGLVYNLSYYSALSLRKKEDIFNPLIACFSAGALFHLRKGWKPSIMNGLNSCLHFGAIESSMYLFQKYQRKKLLEKGNDVHKKYKNCDDDCIVYKSIKKIFDFFV